MKYQIVMATRGLQINGNSLNEKALGGSETAFISVAKEFAKIGHNVKVYCECDKPGIYDGVEYNDIDKWQEFMACGETDILIVSRHFWFFADRVHSKLNILWNHDILTPEVATQFMGVTTNIDYMYFLSKFHKKCYTDIFAEVGDMAKPLFNGVDLDLVKTCLEKIAGNKRKEKIMFTSRPERGLDKALDIYAMINRPDLEFVICSYGSLKDPQVEQIEKACQVKINNLKERGFNIRQGSFKKDELYTEMCEAKLVIYPTDFPEIFCISSIEAQACGAVFLTVDDFALPEVTPYSGLKRDQKEFRKNFAENVEKLLDDDKLRAKLALKGLQNAEQYSWKDCAEKMLTDAENHFSDRSADTKGIIDRLIYESDFDVARQIAKKHDLRDYIELLDHKLRFVEGRDSLASIYEDETTHSQETYDQGKENSRYQWVANRIKELGLKSCLDYACHTGISTMLIKEINGEDFTAIGYDISSKAVNRAKETFKEEKNISFTSKEEKLEVLKFDALFCGEYLEHTLDPASEIDRLSGYVNDGGKLFFTVPKGAWEFLSRKQNLDKGVHYHVHSFDRIDLEYMLSYKKDLKITAIPMAAKGVYNEVLGQYLIEFTKTPGRGTISKLDKGLIERKELITRPYQSISCCVIARNADREIETMLESLKDRLGNYIPDEIIIGDDSSDDDTAERARAMGAIVYTMPQQILKDEWGFANARNFTVSKAKGKWILWIDSDEIIEGLEGVRSFLEGGLINAFTIKQHHPQMDNYLEADTPLRLFKRGMGQFEGFIHEQPQSYEDINKSINPAMKMQNINIINYGARNEKIRRDKVLNRNLPLLKKDVAVNVDQRAKDKKPVRKLSLILTMRDFLNRMQWGFEKFNSYQTKDNYQLCLPQIRGIYKKYFEKDQDPLFRRKAEEIMEMCYERMSIGIPVKIQIGDDDAPDKMVIKRRLDKTDIDPFFEHNIRELKKIAEQMIPPA